MGHKHILVIEDDIGIQAVTKFSLEIETNWTVTTAFLGKEGITQAQNQDLDAILLDLIMPDLNGFDVLRELKTNTLTNFIPVILFTAKLIKEEMLQYRKAGVVGIITKPFDCLTLANQISDILGWQYS